MKCIAIHSIYDAVKPLYFFLRLMGFCAIPWNSSPNSKSNYKPRAYVAFFIVLNTFFTYYSLVENQMPILFASKIMSKSFDLFYIIYLLNASSSIIYLYIVRFDVVAIFEEQHQLDKIFNKLNLKINFTSHFVLLVATVLAVLLSALSLCTAFYFYYMVALKTGANASWRQSIYLVYIFNFLLTMLYATAMVLLPLQRFSALNQIFRMYFPTTPTSGGFLTTTAPGHTAETAVCSEKEQLTVLRQIKILHDKLNDVVELVNYCFSVQITFCVGLCFVIGVVCSFGLFRAFIYRNELFYMGVLNFIWYMYYLFFVLFFIAVGSKITREGKRIGVLVHKAINCSTSTAVINELNIFSQQLLHRSPVITCGLFVYDWTLLYTMIGATATYLIILIQFDVSFPNLVNVNGTATSPGV